MVHLLNILVTVFSWAVVVALTVGITWLLVRAFRWVLRRSVGQPQRRAAMILGYTFGLFLLWSGSRIVP